MACMHSLKCVHVAGTNGKGSTSHSICSVLMEAGYKVGLYTSPHLKTFTERIKINGADIPEKEVVDFAGTSYLRDYDYAKAIEWFKKSADKKAITKIIEENELDLDGVAIIDPLEEEELFEKELESNPNTDPPTWILKPSTVNKGQGIQIVHLHEQLIDICWTECNIREWQVYVDLMMLIL